MADERLPDATVPSRHRPTRPPADVHPAIRLPGMRGRWDATEVTFGLRGRLVATVLLLIPLAWFIMTANPAFGLVGLVTYAYYLRMGLRDVWRRSDRL